MPTPEIAINDWVNPSHTYIRAEMHVPHEKVPRAIFCVLIRKVERLLLNGSMRCRVDSNPWDWRRYYQRLERGEGVATRGHEKSACALNTPKIATSLNPGYTAALDG